MYRTVAGILGGNLVTSQWTACVGKQGRDDEQQADFEIASSYQNKLTRDYHATKSAVAKGSHFFKPMLAQEYKGWQGPCFAQPKLDGARCIATKDGLFSRQGKPFVSVPHIWEALKPIFEYDPSVVLDGELYNHVLKDDFGQIMSLIRQQKPTAEDLAKSADLIQYHIYDLPSHPGIFSDRSHSLQELLTPSRPDRSPGAKGNCFELVRTWKCETAREADLFHLDCMTAGYEGSMVRLNTPYEQKRSKSLLKRKEFKTAEFRLLALNEGIGNWSGVAKSVDLLTDDGKPFSAGIKGTKERAAELLHEKWSWVTLRFFEFTPDGIPRFPVAIDFHNGRVD